MHYRGFPPEIAEADQEPRELMPWPRILILVQRQYGDFLLYRFTDDGTFAGDTWHSTREDADLQVEHEYPGLVDEWKPIPPEVPDKEVLALALSRVNEQDN